MRLGPTIIRKCSACFKPIQQRTLGSGNTFGATHWTDGKLQAYMLPDRPLLVMCPHCHVPLWIDELEKLGVVGPWGDEEGQFKDARRYETPSLDDYFALLAIGVGEPKKERCVRVRAWWAGNDKRRAPGASEMPITSREAANILALALTLDESDARDLLMKAEAMRELGRFDDTLSLLAKSADAGTAQAVEIIRSLSEKRDPYVRAMRFK